MSAQIQANVFGRPLALPVLPAELDAAAPGAAGPAWITVRFAVNEIGRPEHVEVIECSQAADDKHISRLRQAIDKGFDRPLIQTVRGAGYSLRAD